MKDPVFALDMSYCWPPGAHVMAPPAWGFTSIHASPEAAAAFLPSVLNSTRVYLRLALRDGIDPATKQILESLLPDDVWRARWLEEIPNWVGGTPWLFTAAFPEWPSDALVPPLVTIKRYRVLAAGEDHKLTGTSGRFCDGFDDNEVLRQRWLDFIPKNMRPSAIGGDCQRQTSDSLASR